MIESLINFTILLNNILMKISNITKKVCVREYQKFFILDDNIFFENINYLALDVFYI